MGQIREVAVRRGAGNRCGLWVEGCDDGVDVGVREGRSPG